MNKLDEHLDRIQEFEPISTAVVLTVISAANLLMGATRLYKQNFTKASRACSDLETKEKAMCLLRAKILAKNTQRQYIRSNFSKCMKTKDVNKCKIKFSSKMQKLTDEIEFYTDRLQSLKKELYTKIK